MQTLDLNGMWSLCSQGAGGLSRIPVEIPGGVHPALMVAGLIPDPGFGDNAEKLKWIGETAWTFERPFIVDTAFLSQPIIDLVFDGLDTLADVSINGHVVLEADDMFRRWSVDVKDTLREGENLLRVIIKPGLPGAGRKARYGFGSVYSPKCVTAGIFRPVHLTAWNDARICDFGFSQCHAGDSVMLYMGGLIEVAGDDFDGYRVVFTVTGPDGAPVWHGDGRMAVGGPGAFNGIAEIESPKLWWPNGMGEQPLYTVTTVLRDASGRDLDRVTRRVGLRTLTVETEGDAVARLMCNGRFVFLKGAVWIPPGLFPSHVMPEDYAFLVGSAAEIGMNAFRIWEGGAFEDELFWDACDERGIIVTGLASMFPEGTDNDAVAGSLVAPFYHACLPDDLLETPDETNGLRMLRAPVSYPHPETLEAHVPPADRNLTGPTMEARVAGNGGAAGLIGALAASWPLPLSFRDWVWLSQIAHGVDVCSQIARSRADPLCSGVMWKPFASCWAIADGSSIDTDGHWKALHYLAQAAFSPIMIEGIFCEPDRIDVRVANAGDVSCQLKLTWRITTLSGLMLEQGKADCVCPNDSFTVVRTLDVGSFIEQYSRRDLVIWLTVCDAEDFVVSRTPVLLALPRELALEDPHLALDIDDTLTVESGEEAFQVTLSSTSPAFWVWLDIPGELAQFSDNFVCLEPDVPIDIYVSTLNRMTQFAFRRKLRVRSLYDIAGA